MRSLRRLVAALVLVSPLAFSGCKQGVGDRCQVDDDCDDGLRCTIPLGETPQAGGTCQPVGSGDAGITVDMASTPDLAHVD
jgi:hypothetical protein